MPTLGTTMAARANRLLNQVEERGLDRRELVEAAGLGAVDLADPDRRIPVLTLWRLWREVSERLPDPDLGIELGSESRRPATLIGYLMMCSATLHEGLSRLVRYTRVISDVGSTSLTRHGDEWVLSFDRWSMIKSQRPPIDQALTVTVTMCRAIVGDQELAPSRIDFPYKRPSSLSRYREVFRGVCRFDADPVAIAFRHRDILRPALEADDHLARLLQILAEQRLTELGTGAFAERVRRAIWVRLADGPPAVDDIAAELAVSRRTLQRRLREEDTTFNEVLDDLRRTMSTTLLEDRRHAVYQVAYLLGYSEPSTFFRAFRRWYGDSPQRYRAAQSGSRGR